MAIEGSFLLFMLVFMRMSGFILLNPIYGRRNIPIIAKIMIIFSLSIIITIYYGNEVVITNDLLELTGLLLKEFTIGYIIGFICVCNNFRRGINRYANGVINVQDI